VIIQPSLINIGERFNIISAGDSQSNYGMIVWPRRPASAHKCVRKVAVTHAAQCIFNIVYRMVNKVFRIQKCYNEDQVFWRRRSWLCSPIQANVTIPNLTMKASFHILSYFIIHLSYSSMPQDYRLRWRKVVHVHATQAFIWRVDVQLHSLLKSALDMGGWPHAPSA
jgi:hypothetical protein